MEVEGRYSNVATDPGGETAWGISSRYHPEMFLNGVPTREQAKEFYKKELWIPMRLDEIKSDKLVEELFDTAVNLWSTRTIRFAQLAHNEAFGDIHGPIATDGVIGPITIAALNKDCSRPEWEAALINIVDHYQGEHYLRRKDFNNVRGWFAKRIANVWK